MNIKKVTKELKKANPEWNGDYYAKSKSLNLNDAKISDLTPLKGMPLKELDLSNTNVSDLTPLKGMPLEWLSLKNTPAAEKPLPEWLEGVDVYGWSGMETNTNIKTKMTEISEVDKAIYQATAEKDKEIERLEKVIKLQEEFIELSRKENESLIGIASVHGWKSKYADEGKMIRDELKKLKGTGSKNDT